MAICTQQMAQIREVAELAARCAELAERAEQQQRVERLAAVARWCEQTVKRLIRGDTSADAEFRADVASVAWEIAQYSAGQWPPSEVIRQATKMVAAGRHIESDSIEDRQPELRQDGVDFDRFQSTTDPARVVAFRIDFAEWLATRSRKQGRVAEQLAAGHTPAETAQQMRCNQGTISRIRRELCHSWRMRFGWCYGPHSIRRPRRKRKPRPGFFRKPTGAT